MTTISDVAKLANVSISTVSYAISGKRPIRSETRKRILDAMATLDFTPNVHARRLAGNRSGIIALLCPPHERMLGHSEMSLVSGALDQAQAEGFQLLIWMLETADLPTLKRHLSQGLIDGLMVMEVYLDDPRVTLLQDADIPFVLLGRTENPDTLDYVDTDFTQLAQKSLQSLHDLGHRTVAFINQSDTLMASGYGPTVRMETAMRSVAQALGINLVSHRAEAKREAGSRAYDELMMQNPAITAFVTINEPATIGLIARASQNGCSVPDEISILTLLSSKLIAEMSATPLTTCGPDLSDIGRAGTSILLRRLEDANCVAMQSLIDSTLIERGSTGPVTP